MAILTPRFLAYTFVGSEFGPRGDTAVRVAYVVLSHQSDFPS